MKISVTIILISLFPSLLAILFASQIILREFQITRNLNKLSILIELSIKISDIIHEVQKERGITSGFIGSKGKNFVEELKSQREETDKKLTKLKNEIKNFEFGLFDEFFEKTLKSLLFEMNKISDIQKLVDIQSIKAFEAIEHYTAINSKSLDFISSIGNLTSHSEIAISLMAYTSFLRAKEKAGIERAIGVNTLTNGRLGTENIKNFLSLSIEQGIYNRIFLSYAKKDQIAEYEEITKSFEFKEVSKIRKMIYETALRGQRPDIKSKYWFDNITKKINRLKEVENSITNDLHNQMESLIQLSNSKRLRVLLVVLFFIVLLTLFSVLMIYVIQSSFSKVVQSTVELARGNLKIDLPKKTNNEMGDIIQSLEMFRENGLKKQKLSIELQKQRENLEKEVKKRTLDLTHSNAELEEFSYRTSHDLRAPLISSIGLLKVAQDSIKKNVLDKALKSVDYSKKSLEKLELLVQEILDIARAKNEKEEIQEVAIEALLDETINKFSHLNRFERLKFQKDLRFNEPLFLKKNRLVLIVENLISNAIKYQDVNKNPSFVKISTNRLGEYFVLVVENNGLSIPKERHKELFTMFKRFHSKVAFGSGLGLYIMKKSADVLNGEISFESLDQSTIFKLKVPIHQRK